MRTPAMAILSRLDRSLQSTFTCRVALLIALCAVSAWTISSGTVRPPIADGYEKYAFSLAEWNVFAPAETSSVEPAPGLGRAPLYPLFLAAIMRLDPRDRERGRCHVDLGNKCPLRGGLTPLIQVGLASASILAIFEIAILFGARPFLALAFSIWPASSVVTLLYEFQVSEALALPLFGLTSLCLARWFAGRGSIWVLIGAGALLGLLALTRVAYDLFVPVVSLVVFVTGPKCAAEPGARKRAVAVAAILAAYATVVAPWHMRNLNLYGAIKASDAGVAGVLAMRASYNRMTLEEGLVAIVHFLPSFGDQLAEAMFPERITSRFDFSEPHGFRQQGWAILAEVRRRNAGAVERALLEEMLSSPVRHALVSIPLTVDGLRYVFCMLPFALWGAAVAVRKGHWWILAATAMTIFNLVFHAALTHFRARYGMPMVFGVAPLGALGATCIVASVNKRWCVPAGSRE